MHLQPNNQKLELDTSWRLYVCNFRNNEDSSHCFLAMQEPSITYQGVIMCECVHFGSLDELWMMVILTKMTPGLFEHCSFPALRTLHPGHILLAIAPICAKWPSICYGYPTKPSRNQGHPVAIAPVNWCQAWVVPQGGNTWTMMPYQTSRYQTRKNDHTRWERSCLRISLPLLTCDTFWAWVRKWWTRKRELKDTKGQS